MTLKLTIPCPFGPCEANPVVLQEQPPPPGWPGAAEDWGVRCAKCGGDHHEDNHTEATGSTSDFRFRPSDRAAGPIARIGRHQVEGPMSQFGPCPASFERLPLSDGARENLRKQALDAARMFGGLQEKKPQPPGAEEKRRPVPGVLHGNDLPPGDVADRVWEKVACAKCGAWIVRVRTGWRHQRADGTEWFPVDGHAARPKGDEERLSAADVSVCLQSRCGRPIIRTAAGWEHRDGDDHGHFARPSSGTCTWPGCGRQIVSTSHGWQHRDSEPPDHHRPTL